MKTIPFLFLFLSVFFICVPESVLSSHAAGAELQYECIGPNQYKIILKFYRDCTGISAPANPTVQLTAPGCAGATTINVNLFQDAVLSCGATSQGGCEVSPSLCNPYLSQTGCQYTGAGAPPYPGIKLYVYSNTVTLPAACSAWKIRFTESARNPSNNLVNATGNNLSIEAVINNSVDTATGQPIQNNSVKFTNLPVFMVCANSPTWYNHGAFDSDGDSLVFSLITPLGNSAPMTFAAGWSVSQPIRTNPPGSLSFSSTNGQLSFTPSNQETDVLAVQANEYRHGVLVGTTVRDMQLYVLNCISYMPEISNVENANGAVITDTNTVSICYGASASFNITAYDPGHSVLTVTPDLQNNPKLASNITTSQTAISDSVTLTINWISNAFYKGCHTFLVTATNHNCPVTGSLTKEFKVCVDTGLQAYSSAPVYCGSPLKLGISGGNNVAWAPAAGLSDSTSHAPWAFPTVPTTYVVTSSCGVDSIFIDTATTRQVDAGFDTLVCDNAPVLLNALYPTASVSKTIWSATVFMADSLAGMSGYNTPSLLYTNASSSTLFFLVEYADGCIVYDSVLVTGKTVPDVKANTTMPISCPGVGGNELVAALNSYCGTVSTPACPTPTMLSVGMGTIQTPSGNPTQYPTIYGNYQKSARHQFLYKAAELNGLNGGGGVITALAFNIAQFNGATTFKNFTIRIGCTGANELITWESNIVEVFSPKDVNVSAAGWMIHNLDYPYQWDGVSNLVIDVCFFNTTGGVLNSKMMATATTDYTVLYSTDNLVSVCGQFMAESKAKNRPNIRFYFCPGAPYAGNVLWTSLAGLSTISDSTASVTAFTAQATDSFSLALLDTLSGCVVRDTVVVPVSDLQVSTTVTDSKCGINNGSVTAGVSGSYTPYSFLWSNGGNGTTISGLFAGAFSVQVTDAIGCVQLATDTVQALPMFNLSAFTQNASCPSSSDGVAGVVPSNGLPPYGVVWSGGLGVNDTVYNLPTGTYVVTVTDSIGCNSSITLTVQTNDPIAYSTLASPSVCNLSTGSTSVVFPSGNNGYSVAWANGTTGTNLTSVPTGYYTFTITDTSGCSVTDSVFVDCLVSVPAVASNDLSVFPNPANNSFAVLTGNVKGNIKVHTQLGQRIYETTIQGGEQLLNCTDWANGIYYVTVTDFEGNVVGRTRVVKN